MSQRTIHKLLIIRFSSIGDIVLTTPVIRCLKNQLPGVEIHYLVKEQYKTLLAENPGISKIWTYSDNFRELIPHLRAEHFDFVVDLHRNLRSFYVKMRLGRPSAAFPKLNLRKWILVNMKINLLPDQHIVDRYFKAVQTLGIVKDGKGLDYHIPPTEEIDPSGIFPDTNKAFIAFSIGGRHNTKIFPEEKVIEVCNRITGNFLLLGGKEDMERAERIVSRCGPNVVNGCGRFTIHQSASLIRQSAKVITNDTGLMHIAAAFRKPVLSIWGNTVPAFGMYPYMPAEDKSKVKIFEVSGLSCRPCSKIGFDSCPKKHFKCMNDQDTELIIKTLKV